MKIQEIRSTIQDSVLFAKLKKSISKINFLTYPTILNEHGRTIIIVDN